MDDLIQGLLAFSRLGRQALKFCSVDSRQLVVQVLEDLYAMRDQRRVDIVLGTLPECNADPTLLRQVFVNLIGNALKFTRHCNHARIEIGTRTENDERVWYVQDNGAGFDMKYSAKLFGVFQRLHSAQEYEGTGAGLAIVQRIISRHGGRIWATGRVDQGALFCFTLGPPHDHNAGDTRAP
jgi:light-regulated signal transduction histidine kinase (bacteriophytochrome)